jgi:hypothetical protein
MKEPVKQHLAIVAALVLAWTPLSAGQSVFRVRAAAPSGGDGATWNSAFDALPDALVAAVAGDEIWMAAGTYTGVDGRAAFQMKTGVSVYGGFAGTESSRDQRSPAINVTTLRGFITGQPTRTVVAFLGVTGVTLDGFTVTNGLGTGDIDTSPVATSPGGGLYIFASNVLVRGCKIEHNLGGNSYTASGYPESAGGDGGGAFVRDCVVVFENCEFTGNRVSTSFVGECRAGSPTVVGRAGHGAGLVAMNSTVSIIGCGFDANHASNGIAGFHCPSSGYTVPGQPGGSGGAVYAVNCSVVVDRSRFCNNRAGAGGAGTTFRPCPSGGTSGNGGALFFSGGFALITNCSFIANRTQPNGTACSNNFVGLGGAIYAGSLSIRNCLFYANTSVGTQTNVGPISGSSPQIGNSILWANVNSAGSGLSAQLGTIAPGFLANCIVQDLAPGVGNGNNSRDPLFLDPNGFNNILGDADDRFELAFASPAIDAGSNPLAGASTIDLSGNPRFFDASHIPDTGAGAAPIIDIGPLEFTFCPADIDSDTNSGTSDGSVTIDDLLAFLLHFESGSARADLDDGRMLGVLDNAVTVDDLLFFLVRFEAGC